MNIYDISEKAGVSIATVSRVLNGSEKVSPKTRKKVLDVMEQYNFTPNTFARGLGLNTIRTIGILCADSSDLYLAKAVYYIEQMLREYGYDSVLCCTGYDFQNKNKYVNLLLSKKVDSIILVGSHFVSNDEETNSYIAKAARQLPVMILNADYVMSNVYCYLCDDYNATRLSTDKLIQDGRDKIAYFYNSTSYSCTHKLNGYLDAMKQAGLEPHAEYIEALSGQEASIAMVMERLGVLKKQGFKPDGIVTSDDSLAIGAVKYMNRECINIPDEVSIIGYNNSLLATCIEPELTSVDNRLETLCRQLVSNLVSLLDGEEIPRKTLFSGNLITRKTT